MMRDSLVAICLALVACSTPATPAWAGECVEYGERYVVALEAGTTDPYFETAVDCFGSMPISDGTKWAGPVAAAKFEARRQDPLRPRILAAIEQLALSKWAQDRVNLQMLYRIAARWGVAEFNGTDVFEALLSVERVGYHGVREDLAILGDCRAASVLRSQYRALDPKRDKGGMDIAEDILSCLYHIPCDEAISVARELLEGEEDLHLQERIQRVIDR
jgi:hypothetical protein